MSVDFKSALEKARAVAAKLNQGLTPASVSPANLNPTSTVNYTNTINNGSSNGNASLKRNLDDDDSIVGNLKKMAYSNTSLSNDSNSSNINMKQNNKQNNIHNANMPQKSSNGNTIFKPSQIFLDGCIQNGEKILDILIPGQKVGFVIGKGGDMIRQLQERANVKMTIIQQSSEVSDSNKQLRIVGDPNKVDNAHQMVKELLVEKEMEMMKYKNKSQQQHQSNNHSASNEYGSMPQNYVEIPVSPQYIGLVIGKGGENIKRISQETGAKVTVDVSKTDSNGNKLCQISANNPNSLNIAADMVRDMLNNAMSNKRAPQPGTEEVKISVPQNKTGIVIGKGGETIRAIKQQCGCNIELEKNSKGIFNIRGTSDRIQYAQQVIGEKIGGQSLITVLSSTIQNNQQAASSAYADPYSWAATQAQFAYPQIPNTTSAATAANPAGTQDNAAAWAAYSQYYSQYYSQMQQQMAQQQQLGQTTPATGQEGQQEDYTKQWIAYYRAVGMEEEALKLENMEKQKKSAQSAVTTNST